MEHQLIQSHALIIVKNGLGRLTVDLHDYRLRQDAVHIALPGQTIGVTLGADEELELYVIKFDVSGDSASKKGGLLKGEVQVYPDNQMSMLCDLMLTYCRSEQPLERFRGQSTFQELLYGIMKNVRLRPESDSRTALDRTKAYIDSHYHENLNIEQLARMAEISPKYYVDLFKKTYGKSTIDYVTEVRVNSAKQFMVQSDARLRDIAHQVGYNDEFYFSRKFKQEVGVSPTAYMKNRRRKIVAYTTPIIGQLLALKMIPYAAPLHPKWTAYYHKMYRMDIPIHLSAYRFNEDWESNIEALIRADPDMVISSRDDLHLHEKEKLEKVAPVFFVPWKEKNWREQLQLTAQFVGASQEADAWLHKYDRKVKFAREQLNRELRDDTVLIMSIFKNRCNICPTRGMRDVLYHDLQLNCPNGFNPTAYNQLITAEELAAYDPDRILVNVCHEPESLSHWQSLQTSPLWRDLKAVRRNHAYVISSDPWREYSASASERMIDDVLRHLYGDRPN
ncbi:ABC transporter substrate-binding protein [Paenibacillus sp. SYP-B3998]|uniref:ABC transporter substrate-binding protein n=2 Tax=Paenibacillus sp. SYP-B3998 TaxID=2678564 RepID=A0A6G3ZW93_9BACL|nr:ABC transporter substrate-binding protein [Paenibacillus sp. SYP-B3998]